MAFSAGDAAGGAAQGASAGAMIGGPIGAGVGAVVGGLAGGILGGKSRSAAKRAARAQRRIAAMTAFREKVGAQNSYEAQRAEAVAGAATEGRMNDSSVQGALGAFATQQNAAYGFTNAVEKQMAIVAKASAKAARYADYNQIAGQLMGAAGSLFKGAGVAKAGAASTAAADPHAAENFTIRETQTPSFFSQNSGQTLTFFSQ